MHESMEKVAEDYIIYLLLAFYFYPPKYITYSKSNKLTR
jgi:hypothetical protein